MNGSWSLPNTGMTAANNVWRDIQLMEIPNNNCASDKLLWLPEESGEFSFRSAFNSLRVQHSKEDKAFMVSVLYPEA